MTEDPQWPKVKLAEWAAEKAPRFEARKLAFLKGCETTQRTEPKSYERCYGGPPGGSMKD